MSARGKIFFWDVEREFGTGHDVAVICETLREFGLRHDVVRICDPAQRSERIAMLGRRLLRLDVRTKLQIFMQFALPDQMWFGKTNIVFPNYEHTNPKWIDRWKRADRLACKTSYAERLIRELGGNAIYVGFKSTDERLDEPLKSFREFLHVSGRSAYKGTFRMLDLWKRRPDWPRITVTRCFFREDVRAAVLSKYSAKNIHIIADYMPRDKLLTLKNRVGIHLCLSEAEGFGHYIRNAMSTGAVVVTTDAPPMNEHITPEAGVLVPISRSEPTGLGERFLFDEFALEQSIDCLLGTPEPVLASKGKAARVRFLELNSEFPRLFGNLLRELEVLSS